MKPMDTLLTLLPNSKRAGIYRSAIGAAEIVAAATTAGLRAYKIDLAKAHGKSGLFDAFAKALRFPEYFGKNWDAFNDCLSGLSWLDGRGWVLILSNCRPFATHHEADFDMTLDLLEGVVATWQEEGRPFWVIVKNQAGWTANLPKFLLG